MIALRNCGCGRLSLWEPRTRSSRSLLLSTAVWPLGSHSASLRRPRPRVKTRSGLRPYSVTTATRQAAAVENPETSSAPSPRIYSAPAFRGFNYRTPANKKSAKSRVSDEAPAGLLNVRPVYSEIRATWDIHFDHPELKSGTAFVPRIWLRDNCQCDQCVHPETKQRMFDIFSAEDQKFEIKDCTISDGKVFVTWKMDDHNSEYSLEWLASAFNFKEKLEERQLRRNDLGWGPNDAAVREKAPEVEYEAIMNSESGMAEWTRKILEIGFCFVNGCPKTPEATKALLERIGPIRNTHYGTFWDFTADLASKDTAYTSLGLGVHTDTTYFSEPAGFQMFHLLSHEGTGGGTQLVDGFAAAQQLKRETPKAYRFLRSVRIMAHASGNDGLSIQPQGGAPTISESDYGRIDQIRWNPSDRSMIDLKQSSLPAALKSWYNAARMWNGILQQDSPNTRYEFKLEPGRPLIFDNWRVLHGRSAFTGQRRMCGGYLNRDDFMSRYRVSNFGYENVLSHGIS